MPLLMLQCKTCSRIFSSGIFMSPGTSATFINNKSQCPFCYSMQSIPDRTFKATIEGFINILKQTDDPLNKANELLKALQTASKSKDIAQLKRSQSLGLFNAWLPNSIEKVAAYIAITYTVIQLLTKSPDININYNTFVSQYNETVKIKMAP